MNIPDGVLIAVQELPLNFNEADLERFWDKVIVGKLEDCWIYQGYTRSKRDGGHGQFKVKRKNVGAHRFALASTGVDVEGKIVRHRCDLAACVNPHHLITGDMWDNNNDRVARDRSAKGEDNGRAVLTEEIVIRMRKDRRPHYRWAKKLGVDTTTVSLARRGITWAYLNEDHPPITKTDI